jgi:hypothetical protein
LFGEEGVVTNLLPDCATNGNGSILTSALLESLYAAAARCAHYARHRIPDAHRQARRFAGRLAPVFWTSPICISMGNCRINIPPARPKRRHEENRFRNCFVFTTIKCAISFKTAELRSGLRQFFLKILVAHLIFFATFPRS